MYLNVQRGDSDKSFTQIGMLNDWEFEMRASVAYYPMHRVSFFFPSLGMTVKWIKQWIYAHSSQHRGSTLIYCANQ